MPYSTFSVPPLQANCTIIHDSAVAAVVDPGLAADKVINELKQSNLKLMYIIISHAHFDHVGDLIPLKRAFPEARIVLGNSDADLYKKVHKQPMEFGMPLPVSAQPEPDVLMNNGDTLSLGDLTIKALEAPGHSPGSICLYIEKDNVLIAGDVLFQGSCGRSDLWQGNGAVLKESIRNLLFHSDLPVSTVVVAGHGPNTTVGAEQKSFPLYSRMI
ncbi:hypothetical protein P9112_004397 [Eukaryota sp. TZLM1-RC]